MSDYDLDFNEVRRVDIMFKKRQNEWSGQDVLDSGLDMKSSASVLARMNKLRVWPKGFHRPIKKAKSLLKAFIRTSLFENLMTLSVLVNTIGMALDSYDIDP